ncbi:uncharacterized protein LOC118266322 isoform X3 [Spodoptera frugiperda]|uniref:Uncharacterized protein LOC118266322 isoform X3 n=1 Tax=Spodoptera frugiperda TaxID=7108 RepID=A0A9R0F377_SPOFR|nr:uncharacterized protein LOC118266322 isoform X3 [Spodoptera frugiperda]
MAKQDDGLFLLEVLIDKIVFVKSPCFSDKDFRTCVTIEAPSVQALEICDDDPGSCVAKSGGPFVKTFNSGKSCLFSLLEADINKAMSSFPIKISVFKSLPCGCLPTKIIMGEATIDMTKEFVQSRKKFLEDPTNVSYQALKDSFRIVGPDGSETGEVVMFLRISCFGKLIITRFQGVSAPPRLGGARDPSFVDRSCNPKREFQTTQDPCVCGAAQGAASSVPCTAPCRTPGGGGRGVCPIAQDPYSSMPCEDPDDPCYCSGAKPPPKPPMVCRNTEQYCLHIPKDCCPPGNKVVFQMPSDTCGMNHKQRAHFNFTSDGVGDVARDDPQQLVPTTAEEYPGVVYDFPPQVIKLRIGKIIEMPGRKSKLEYQFITPVANNEKVIPTIETRTAQCLPTCPDCCPNSKSPKR